MRELKASSEDSGKRTDIFVAEHFSEYTRASLRGLFDAGSVTINNETAKPGYKLREGDEVSVNTDKLMAEPEKIELPIIFEDENIIVINKPAGVLSHSKGALNLEGTVASFIKEKIKDERLSGNRAGIVHRLDRATSGVMIAAKNQEALSHLQKQFSQRKTKKIYFGIVEGTVAPTAAVIEAPIERDPHRPQTFKVSAGGRPAITEYKTIKSFEVAGKNYSLLEIKPLTGRTHQIRVHLAYIGHPIAGDRQYGKEGRSLMLHAKSLEVTLPGGKRQRFIAEAPDRIKDLAGI